MPVTIDWATQTINVPKSYLTLISGTLYELDTDAFRLDLKDLEDDEVGMPFQDTHETNPPVTIAGVTYARTLAIINGYSVEFEDGQYSVILQGTNNDIWDVESGILVQNQVQVIPTNSAGYIVVETGTSGLTSEESTQLASVPNIETSVSGIESDVTTINSNIGTINTNITNIATDVSNIEGDTDLLNAIEGGRWKIVGSVLTYYDEDNTTPIRVFELRDSSGNPTTSMANVVERFRTGP